MFRCLCVALVAQLGLGCSTMRPVDPTELRKQLRSSGEPIALRAQDGSTVRLDPNSELRFHLHGGSVTRWVRAREIWHSPVGLSFREERGVFVLRWNEIAGAEVSNLSSGKTAAAIVISAVVVGAIVVAVIASVKGGGGGGSFHIGAIGGSSGGSHKRSKRGKPPVAQRQLRPPAPGGVHVHVPVVVLAAHHVHHAPRPTPELKPMLPVHAEAAGEDLYALTSDSVADPRLGPAPTATDGPTAPLTRPPAEIRATPLFDGGMRRRFSIQLVASAAGGTEFARFDRYSGSLYVGLRIKDAFDLGAGVRHMLAPLSLNGNAELRSSVIGFGRVGAHLGFGVKKLAAIALSLDAGSGYNTLLQLKFNLGLRFKPMHQLSVGLFPFTPTFNYYKEDSEFGGALRWTFPSTIEVAFNY